MSKGGDLDGTSRVMVDWSGLHPTLHSVDQGGERSVRSFCLKPFAK